MQYLTLAVTAVACVVLLVPKYSLLASEYINASFLLGQDYPFYPLFHLPISLYLTTTVTYNFSR